MLDPNRDPLDCLVEDFLERKRNGEAPSITEYVSRYPDMKEEIRELFPMMVEMELLKAKKARADDGCASMAGATLERLGDFRIISEIGRGGMGIVYKADQESLERPVAIKVLPKQSLLDPRHLKRFQREAKIAASLHHTNIAPVMGVGCQDGFHYYAMQYIEGVGLERIIDSYNEKTSQIPLGATTAPGRRTGMPHKRRHSETAKLFPHKVEKKNVDDYIGKVVPLFDKGENLEYYKWVARIGIQVGDALHYAHQQGTLHRDIKPGNLLIDQKGTIWVTDFGLARALQSERVTRSEEIMGTLRYMAPEQLLGNSDYHSDLYSLGITLYEMATLEPAFSGVARESLIRKITQGKITHPSIINPFIPRDLETIILKAVSLTPKHRYQTGGELAKDLERFLEDKPVAARRVNVWEKSWRWCRRNPLMAGLAATTFLALVLVATITSFAYVRTNRALKGEAFARLAAQKQEKKAKASETRAKQNAQIALSALDEIFERFATHKTITVKSSESQVAISVEVPNLVTVSGETALLLESMLKFYSHLSQEMSNDVMMKTKIADAHHRVAIIRSRLGQYRKALEAYNKTVRFYQDLLEQSPVEEKFLRLAKIHNEIGQLHHFHQQDQEADIAHLNALSILERKSKSIPVLFEKANTYYLLGTAEFEDISKYSDQSLTEYDQSFHQSSLQYFLPLFLKDEQDLWQMVTADRPNYIGKEFTSAEISLISLTVDAFQEKAIRNYPESSFKEKAKYLDAAIAIFLELQKLQPFNPQFSYYLSLSYLESFRLSQSREKRNVVALNKATQILQKLTKEHPEVTDYRYALSKAYAAVELEEIRHDFLPVLASRFTRAIEVIEPLSFQGLVTPEYAKLRINLLEKSGLIYGLYSQSHEQAKKNHEQVIRLAEEFEKRFPEDIFFIYKKVLSRYYLFRILLLSDLYKEKVLTRLEKEITQLETLLEAKPEQVVLRWTLIQNYKLLSLHLSEKKQQAIQANKKLQEHQRLLQLQER